MPLLRRQTGYLIKKILGCALFFSLSFGLSFLEASQLPSSQDVGATVSIEKIEKEQKAMMKRLTRKKKMEIKGVQQIQALKSTEKNQ